jgi:hypothetical protein
MKEKILVFLKSKLTGVSESFLSGVAETWGKTIKEEKDIETTFTEGIIETLKFSALELQKEGDRRATEASKTALKTFQEKHGLDENGKLIEDPTKKKPKKDVDPEEPAWFTAFKESQQKIIDGLTQKIETQEKEKTSNALTEKVKAHEKLKGIPASYLKGRNLTVESEDKIEELVKGIESDWNTFKQDLADQGTHISIPASSTDTVKEGETTAKAIADKRNNEGKAVKEGKKV